MNYHQKWFTTFSISVVLVFLLATASFSGVIEGTLTGLYPPDHSSQNALNDIWGISESDIFAVGNGGVIKHYDGSIWSEIDSGTDKDLRAIWGSSGTDAFVLGADSTMLHYDGSQWSAMGIDIVAPISNIWKSSGSTLYVVAGEVALDDAPNFIVKGSISFFDGKTWNVVHNITDIYPTAIWANSGSSTDIFYAGYGVDKDRSLYSTIQYFNGFNSTLVISPQNVLFNAIWGISMSNVYAVGSNGTILHYNGHDWSDVDTGISKNSFLTNIWAFSSSDVFIIGSDYDLLTQWYDEFSSGNTLSSQGSNTRNNIILHFDGRRWTQLTTDVESQISAIWSNSHAGFWGVCNDGTIFRFSMEEKLTPCPDQEVTVRIKGNFEKKYTKNELHVKYGIPSDFSPLTDVIEFSADIDQDKSTAAFRFLKRGIEGMVSDLSLYKLKTDRSALPFKSYATSPDVFTEGAWWLTDEQGNYIGLSETLDKDTFYYVSIVIKDNGEYDLDDTLGSIRDPLVLGTNSNADGSSGCFIATAAYGSSLEPHVRLLKKFRDRYLLTNPFGRSLVRLYYKYSPAPAEFIAGHPWLKKIVQIGLLPFIAISWIALRTGFFAAVLLTFMFFTLLAVALHKWNNRTNKVLSIIPLIKHIVRAF